MERVLGLSSALIFVLFVAGLAAQTGKTGQGTITNAKEMKAEDDIAKLVEAFRPQKGLPKLYWILDSHLHEDACQAAKQGRVTGSIDQIVPQGVFGDVGNISTFTYTTLEPNQLSRELQMWAAQTTYWSWTPHRFAVGVCFLSTTEHPDGTYWIDVGYYLSAIKTFLYRFMWD